MIKGIKCPKCGCVTFFVENTKPVVGAIKRWRRCRNVKCGYVIMTKEKIEKKDDDENRKVLDFDDGSVEKT